MPAGGKLRPYALTSTLAERLLRSNLFDRLFWLLLECELFSPVLAELLWFSQKGTAGVFIVLVFHIFCVSGTLLIVRSRHDRYNWHFLWLASGEKSILTPSRLAQVATRRRSRRSTQHMRCSETRKRGGYTTR